MADRDRASKTPAFSKTNPHPAASATDETSTSDAPLPSAPLPGTPLYLPTEHHPAEQNSTTLGAIGPLEVRLASTKADVKRAQHLRYDVFYREMSAKPSLLNKLLKRDFDRYDAISDHLLVLDHDAPRDPHTGGPAIVGTYRLLNQNVAETHGGFYSASEYQIDRLVASRPTLKFLELGRSCVLAPYRTKRTVELLWHGIWSYVVQRKIDVLFGCASLEGTNPEKLALPLSFLHHFASADDNWTVRALENRYTAMNQLAKDQVDQKHALRSLPPLIKGYLRLGAMIGDGAVVDHQFCTTDVLILLPVEKISKRYISYYGVDAQRRAN
ncbi:MAG: GNAT family N-acetyltransferase [Devosiaceae bacterium]